MIANTLFDFLTRCSLNYPSREFIVYGETRLTYDYFTKVVARLAAGLAYLGLKCGDRIAIMLPNVPQFPIVYFALLKLGVWVVPLNVLYKEAEIQYVLEDSEVDGFIAWEGFGRYLLSAAAELRKCRLHVFLGEKVPPNAIALTRLIATSMQRFENVHVESKPSSDSTLPATVLYTAGATGPPKGVVVSHYNLTSAISACWKNFAITVDDRFLAVVPLFHNFGQMMAMNLPMAAGATTVLLPRFDPQAVVETIVQEKITHFVAVPSMLPALLRVAPEPTALASLKCCLVSGAMLPAQVQDEFENRYGAPIYTGYGVAECSPLITTFGPMTPRTQQRACSVGVPLPGLEVAVFARAERQAPDAEIGEIFVRAPWVMEGYLKNGQISKEVFRSDWLPTGDVGSMDGEGFLYLVDRKQDVILKAGFPVYPSEVEAFLLLHPKVEECAVVGVPDSTSGEEVKAYIVLQPHQHASKEEIAEYCRSRLAPYKCPRHLEFCESLPRSVTGKVLRRLLREKTPEPAVAVVAESPSAAELPVTPNGASVSTEAVAPSGTSAEATPTETAVVG
jgi:long-chain acyl-CoA synthetase